MFERGVSYYTKAVGMVQVSFPEDKTLCQFCPYCRDEIGLKRAKCLLTGEILAHPFVGVGGRCPLEIIETEENH